MSDLLVAFGLALMMEGLLYAAFPDTAKRMLALMAEIPETTMRFSALATAVGGLLIVWLVRG